MNDEVLSWDDTTATYQLHPTETHVFSLRNRKGPDRANEEDQTRTSFDSVTAALPPSRKSDDLDLALCRICFQSRDDEPEKRLISPCKCKGSMRYVHLECLNEWREKSQKKESFYECDQCKYRYRFQRTFWAKMVMNELVLFLVTFTLFSLLVFLSGFAAKLVLRYWVLDSPEDITAGVPLRVETEDDDDWLYRTLSFGPESLALTNIDFSHFLAGAFLVGVFASIQVFLSFLTSPFPEWNYAGGRWSLGGGGGARSTSRLGLVIVVVVVLFGMVRTLVKIYGAVKDFSRRGLQVVESAILSVD
ncbi:hypothetical protein M427DRAFT_51412 [Gonapodya prolifera JEL478]|uniref:RING-CH-type domain-containing protein n=1 Tax=Gonapodya prolifera (strain JEL478) TaxID=1344416 RepID=A0A139AWP1_GONPJ|nr:hypothetical protein M427DRAFT_51412 [Gonapodya prolifera JEL478]|eukprot:KXS21140.1 hypothetical protein M427DRAFT_51412 [Gonapodya prolifera JEL478]